MFENPLRNKRMLLENHLEVAANLLYTVKHQMHMSDKDKLDMIDKLDRILIPEIKRMLIFLMNTENNNP